MTAAPIDLRRRRLMMAAPLAVATAAGVGFLAMLHGMREGTFDPRALNSPLIGHPLPDFSLPGQIPDAKGFSSADVRAAGHSVLINFFASWCAPCVMEAPVLMQLRQAGVPLWGIAYKDKPAAVEGFLVQHGNPFIRIASDLAGRVAIDFGVYGVPESHYVDRTGIIRWRWAGPLSSDAVDNQLPALMKRYP
jgi:cytochrome c biogenesis protein CcmG/thiol:disulfide interchange protein DsbE